MKAGQHLSFTYLFSNCHLDIPVLAITQRFDLQFSSHNGKIYIDMSSDQVLLIFVLSSAESLRDLSQSLTSLDLLYK